MVGGLFFRTRPAVCVLAVAQKTCDCFRLFTVPGVNIGIFQDKSAARFLIKKKKKDLYEVTKDAKYQNMIELSAAKTS